MKGMFWARVRIRAQSWGAMSSDMFELLMKIGGK